jgi:hypothetical protein
MYICDFMAVGTRMFGVRLLDHTYTLQICNHSTQVMAQKIPVPLLLSTEHVDIINAQELQPKQEHSRA